MNLSDKSKKKLKQKVSEFYTEIANEVADLIKEDGTIRVKLDNIEKEYTYFYKTTDYIYVRRVEGRIMVEDNFEDNTPDEQVANEKYFNLFQCPSKIKANVIKEIERYNRNNEEIDKM